MIYNDPTLLRRVRRIAAVPSQSGTLTYNGSAQSPAWSNYDPNAMTLGGTASGTNAGSYTATFTPKTGYTWADGSTAAKSVGWTIGKAAGSVSVSPGSLSLDSGSTTKTITVTRAGAGVISATSSNTDIATVSVSGNKVTVTGKAAGSAAITIKVAADANHFAAQKSVSVTMTIMKVTLNILSGVWRQDRCYVEINGTQYYSTASVEVDVGTTVLCYIQAGMANEQTVEVNGTVVAGGNGHKVNYWYAASKNATISARGGYSKGYMTITITET